MKSQFELRIDPATGDIHFNGVIRKVELKTLEAEPLDDLLMTDLGEMEYFPASDSLVVLEQLYRGIEAKHARLKAYLVGQKEVVGLTNVGINYVCLVFAPNAKTAKECAWNTSQIADKEMASCVRAKACDTLIMKLDDVEEADGVVIVVDGDALDKAIALFQESTKGRADENET